MKYQQEDDEERHELLYMGDIYMGGDGDLFFFFNEMFATLNTTNHI